MPVRVQYVYDDMMDLLRPKCARQDFGFGLPIACSYVQHSLELDGACYTVPNFNSAFGRKPTPWSCGVGKSEVEAAEDRGGCGRRYLEDPPGGAEDFAELGAVHQTRKPVA